MHSNLIIEYCTNFLNWTIAIKIGLKLPVPPSPCAVDCAAYAHAGDGRDGRSAGDEDTLQRRPYDSDTADRRDKLPSQGVRKRYGWVSLYCLKEKIRLGFFVLSQGKDTAGFLCIVSRKRYGWVSLYCLKEKIRLGFFVLSQGKDTAGVPYSGFLCIVSRKRYGWVTLLWVSLYCLKEKIRLGYLTLGFFVLSQGKDTAGVPYSGFLCIVSRKRYGWGTLLWVSLYCLKEKIRLGYLTLGFFVLSQGKDTAGVPYSGFLCIVSRKKYGWGTLLWVSLYCLKEKIRLGYLTLGFFVLSQGKNTAGVPYSGFLCIVSRKKYGWGTLLWVSLYCLKEKIRLGFFVLSQGKNTAGVPYSGFLCIVSRKRCGWATLLWVSLYYLKEKMRLPIGKPLAKTILSGLS